MAYSDFKLSEIIQKFELTLNEALTGFKRSIKTLDNRCLIISTLPGNLYLYLIYLSK